MVFERMNRLVSIYDEAHVYSNVHRIGVIGHPAKRKFIKNYQHKILQILNCRVSVATRRRIHEILKRVCKVAPNVQDDYRIPPAIRAVFMNFDVILSASEQPAV